MTREEEREAAIAYIKGYRKLDEDLHNTAPKDSISYYVTDKCLKYWDMAIQALSQESSREFEDYENEIEDLHNRLDIAEYDKERLREEVTNLEAKIQALSQEPCSNCCNGNQIEKAKLCQKSYLAGMEHKQEWLKSQKSGKWIMSDDGLYRPICDKCGAHPWKAYIPTVEEATDVFKFCPNCGAKMESEE